MAGCSGPPEAVRLLLDAAERAQADAADEPFEPTVGVANSMLANVAARIALFRASLAEFSGDTAGWASSPRPGRRASTERLLSSVTRSTWAWPSG